MRLVVVTGPDGSGKSTACAGARERLAARGVSCREAGVWDALEPAPGLPRPPFASRSEAERYLADLDGTARGLFIFHALSRALQLGRRAGPEVLLVNGYWYKYAASELGYGVDPAVVRGWVTGFPEPDQVFFLELDPETAWRRRQAATAYEQGPAGSAESESEKERFIRFQTRLAPEWETIEREARRPWIRVSARLSPADVAGAIAGGVLR
jgi:thymidylate kinase